MRLTTRVDDKCATIKHCIINYNALQEFVGKGLTHSFFISLLLSALFVILYVWHYISRFQKAKRCGVDYLNRLGSFMLGDTILEGFSWEEVQF